MMRVKQFLIFNRNKVFKGILLVAVIFIAFAHLFRLDRIPAGLYSDEGSIGYNAALIAKSGVDEYGVSYPLFFKAFGEYKNPIYIYTASLIFKFFGVSEFKLRFTSFLFYFSALIFSFLLANKLFKQNKIILLYFLLSFGFLPYFFTISRISFEVISQLSLTSIMLFLVYQIFVDQEENPAINLKVLACGLILGLSVYSYSTARLISFLSMGFMWVFFFKRENIHKLFAITMMFLISLIPLMVFTIHNPDALTARFDNISYIYASTNLSEKITTFISNTITYWSPGYLIIHGDANLRHSIGYGGVIFAVTFFMFLLGTAYILANKKLRVNRYILFLFLNLLVSPLAAILTSEGTPHALRSMLLGYYILIFSCYGVMLICQLRHDRYREIILGVILASLFFEITAYQIHYFIIYPAKSVTAMDGYDLKKSLQSAIDEHPREVDYLNKNVYATIDFFSFLVTNPQNIPIKLNTTLDPIPGSCLIFHQGIENELDQYSIPYYELDNHYHLNRLEKFFKVNPPTTPFKVRCYLTTN